MKNGKWKMENGNAFAQNPEPRTQTPDQLSGANMETLIQDLRYSARMLAKKPALRRRH